MSSTYEFLRLERTESVGIITLDRPPLNVLTIAMNRELERALASLAADDHLKAVVLRAEGRAFCAGVDVADHTLERVDEMIHGFARLVTQLRTLAIPTIAVVQGAALGGGTELAMGCDITLAAASARFGQPEITLGVFPPIATALFPQRIGYQQAARLIFTGETVSAQEAARLGLVTEVAPDADLTNHLSALLERLTGLSAVALRLAKRALLLGADGGVDALGAINQLYLAELMATSDAREGIQSFIAKRQPIWRNQ
jgi:cyclohexa-1,5-dienecarbonyl-CoA hydratase